MNISSHNSRVVLEKVLSPYLKFGCVSAAQFAQELYRITDGGKKHSLPPVSLLGQVTGSTSAMHVKCPSGVFCALSCCIVVTCKATAHD